MNEKFKQYSELFTPVSILIAALVVAGSVLFAGGGFRANGQSVAGDASNAVRSQETSGSPVNFSLSADDHIRGDVNAPVKIVEFSDLQCPFCQHFHPTLEKALSEYQGKVVWVYKHFPLSSIHPQAEPAAEASECIAEQKGNEGFWKFADAVFGDQGRIGPDLFREIAKGLNLDMPKFDGCVAQHTYQNNVRADAALGAKSGVQATPTAFVNGKKIEGAVPYETLKAAIDQVLKGN